MVETQYLKCGDIFVFRSEDYVALVNFTDIRHSQTITTAIKYEDIDKPIKNIICFRFFKIFQVNVKRRVSLNLSVIENTDEEVIAYDK